MNKKQVYPNWRIDKNISWYNVTNYFLGLIWGLFTLKIFKKEYNYLLKRGRFWLPIEYEEIVK